MIPVTLITGFLGSGKTTLVSWIYKQFTDRRIVYLINEFSQVDIDGQRLDIPENQLVSIPGGSIFCRCLVSDFIRILRDIESSADNQNQPPEQVVIEASGISDPNIIQQLLQETKLDNTYVLQRIICIIDPGTFYKLIHTLPNIIRQVEASNTIIINKTDMYDEETIQNSEEEIRKINPKAELIKTTYCQGLIDLFSEAETGELSGEYALCRDPNYASVALQHQSPVDWPKLKQDIENLPGAVYRVKGYVTTQNHTIDIDYAADIWTEKITENHPQPNQTKLVVIVEGRCEMSLNLILSKLNQNSYDS
jgi:G3E family GTPase